MKGLGVLGVLLLSCLSLPSPAGSQTSPSPNPSPSPGPGPDGRSMDPEEAPSQHHAAR